MSCEELEIVWNNIKAEARTLADCEPMLGQFLPRDATQARKPWKCTELHAGEQAVIANYACYCYP